MVNSFHFHPYKDTKVSTGSQISKPGISVTQCFYGCLTVTRCQGVNYHPGNQHCFLVSEVDDIESQLQNDAGWIFYEKKEQIKKIDVPFTKDVNIEGEFYPNYEKLLWKIPEFSTAWSMKFKIKIKEQPAFDAKLFTFQTDARKSIFSIIILKFDDSTENIIQANLTTNDGSVVALTLKKKHFVKAISEQNWISVHFKMMKMEGSNYRLYAFVNESNSPLILVDRIDVEKPQTVKEQLRLYHDSEPNSRPKVLLKDFKFEQFETHTWMTTKMACIQDNNLDVIGNIPTINQCKELCEKYSKCVSMDYNLVSHNCYLSAVTKATVPSDYHEPCYLSPDSGTYTEIKRNDGAVTNVEKYPRLTLQTLPKWSFNFYVHIKIKQYGIALSRHANIFQFVDISNGHNNRFPSLFVKDDFTVLYSFNTRYSSFNPKYKYHFYTPSISSNQWYRFEFEHKIQQDGSYIMTTKMDGVVINQATKTGLDFESANIPGPINVKLGFADGGNDAAKFHIKEFFYAVNELDD
uniref:Apple domain-containing protein n=1 Tax=Clytia hemisphaerica TaxID=252671 RepID=A0A7M5U5Z1_9CNID